MKAQNVKNIYCFQCNCKNICFKGQLATDESALCTVYNGEVRASLRLKKEKQNKINQKSTGKRL